MTWEDVVAIASKLPEVEESTSNGTPALKVKGKGFARLRTEAEGGLVLMCGMDEKEALLASGDPAFYTTPHYDGYGAILVDLERVARVPYAHPGTEALGEAVGREARNANVLLLENHGVLVYDTSVREALMGLHTLEMVARMVVMARAAGLPLKSIPRGTVADFLEHSRYRPRRRWPPNESVAA
jgi:hypothetical protein